MIQTIQQIIGEPIEERKIEIRKRLDLLETECGVLILIDKDGTKKARIDLPIRFSSAQAEIEVTAHELAHVVLKTAVAKHILDSHVKYICEEAICDIVADEIRKKIMEDNPIPGISQDIQDLAQATEITQEETNYFYALQEEEIVKKDEKGIGHIVGRKLFVALKPLIEQWGGKTSYS